MDADVGAGFAPAHTGCAIGKYFGSIGCVIYFIRLVHIAGQCAGKGGAVS